MPGINVILLMKDKIMTQVYRQLYNKSVIVRAISALVAVTSNGCYNSIIALTVWLFAMAKNN